MWHGLFTLLEIIIIIIIYFLMELFFQSKTVPWDNLKLKKIII